LSPLDFSFWWDYKRQSASGGFPITGDITFAGAAEVYLNAVLVNNLPTIVPATLSMGGLQAITLPDTNKHTVLLTLPTTSGDEIFTEFEVQIKPLF
ncbi:MAG: hypothetical protein OQK82_03210, partial [Candidatus Pacearchaeota archaeon]|nr:hypothetical protein [Candidatus Pacearchaeota archaeon]